MTSGRPFPLILNFAIPLLLGNLLQQTYSLMDAAIVGKFLGINALASVGASTSVIFLILGFCNGCCGGFGIPIAQKFGARDYSTMRRLVAVSLQLAAVMSVVIAIVTSLFCSGILRMMQTPENILEGAYYYLMITFIGVPCTFFIICCPVSSGRWAIARRPSGFCSSRRYSIFCLICSASLYWIGEWQVQLLRLLFPKVFRLCCVIFI